MERDSAFEQLKNGVRDGAPGGEPALVAVSGGSDSVALARAAHAVLSTPTLAHVNHRWRGPEADEDEAFVRALAANLGLPVRVVRLERQPRSEADARDLRYGALERMRTEAGAVSILLGHTLNDQAETVLLNLLRGSGARGLGGMSVRSGRLVRPFLSVDRATILRALEDIGQEYREDGSNADTTFRRNWLRRRIMPAIEERIPTASRAISRAANLLRDDADYLALEAATIADLMLVEQGEGWARASLGAWRDLHPSLQRGTLRHLTRVVLGDVQDIGEEHVEHLRRHLLDPVSTALDQLPRGLRVHVEGKTFRMSIREDRPESFPEAELPVPGRVSVPGGEIIAEIWAEPTEDQKRAVVVAGPMHALLDAAAIGSPLAVRSRRPGDHVRPLRGSGSRSIQDLFVDRRIPRADRASIPIVLAAGRVVWIPGVAVDRMFAATGAEGAIAHLVMMPKTGA